MKDFTGRLESFGTHLLWGLNSRCFQVALRSNKNKTRLYLFMWQIDGTGRKWDQGHTAYKDTASAYILKPPRPCSPLHWTLGQGSDMGGPDPLCCVLHSYSPLHVPLLSFFSRWKDWQKRRATKLKHTHFSACYMVANCCPTPELPSCVCARSSSHGWH